APPAAREPALPEAPSLRPAQPRMGRVATDLVVAEAQRVVRAQGENDDQDTTDLQQAAPMVSTVLASAADARYGRWLINLIGSVQLRSPLFDRIVVYDLGLTPAQRWLLEHVHGVEVDHVPAFVPHWQQARTWKLWIWTHLEAETIVWLDAGITVLRPLTDFVEQATERGYFVVSTGVPAGLSTPSEYYDLFDLPEGFADRISVSSGILAFRRTSRFYSDVIEPTFEDAMLGHHLGFSEPEIERLNWGLDRTEKVIVRDCPLFRYDQSLFNVHFYRSTTSPHIGDLYKYGGFGSPRDHLEQVIWNHRRTGDYRFLPRVRYRGLGVPVGVLWGTGVFVGRWSRNHAWLFRPAVYTHVLQRLLRTRRLRSQRSDQRPSASN
ncbi:MAG: hypothetical protein ACRDLE_10285, partial [Gaiellaceae bacterium]